MGKYYLKPLKKDEKEKEDVSEVYEWLTDNEAGQGGGKISGCILKALIPEQRDSNIRFLLTSLSTTTEQPANQSARFWFKYAE